MPEDFETLRSDAENLRGAAGRAVRSATIVKQMAARLIDQIDAAAETNDSPQEGTRNDRDSD